MDISTEFIPNYRLHRLELIKYLRRVFPDEMIDPEVRGFFPLGLESLAQRSSH